MQQNLVTLRTLLSFLLAGAGTCPGQGQIRDERNRYIPHTDTHFRMPVYSSLESWSKRKAALKEQILSAAGLLPMPAAGPVQAEIFGRIERTGHGFSIEKVLLQTMPGYYVGGNLYRPLATGRKYPAVLYAHGHHQYGRIEHQHRIHWTVQDEAGQKRERRYPDQVAWAAPMFSPPTMAANLAMQGYVVFSWDMVGYNDTIQTTHTFGGDREKLWGFGPLGLQLWNSIRALDFVVSLPDVDPTRIGMTGASGGGTQTFLLSAIDERVKAAAPVVMVGGIMQGGSPCENAPGLRIGTYNTEIAALVAPRPMMIVGSPVDQSRHTLSEDLPGLRSIYKLYGAEEKAEAAMVDAPHNYNQYSREAVYQFMARHLKPPNASGKISEVAVRFDSPNTLLALHNRTLPPNALGYDAIFEQWRESARAVSSKLTDQELKRVLRAALGVSWPKKVKVEGSGPDIVLHREDSGDRVPAKWFPGGSSSVLLVHEMGSSAPAALEMLRKLKRKGNSVLLIDAFQTGAAIEPRNFTYQKGRPEKGYYLTFNKSDDANRVQDIATALAFLAQQGSGSVQMSGIGKGALWSLFAAAVAEQPIALCAPVDPFQGSDGELIESLFVPGVQRAGGLDAALRLTRKARAGCSVPLD
ncbi:MAG: acetylxylan esterase [Bryobacterales bacterium]|nr:acetylxylan esterase [Bryobacterales bacterium]